MRVLFCGMAWDYGHRNRGHSYEYIHLYGTLQQMPAIEAAHVDVVEAYQRGGHAEVRRLVLEAVEGFAPDLAFFFLFEDEVPRDLLVELRDRPSPTTFNWFADDQWRFSSFTRKVAPLFNACSTTSPDALAGYRKLGFDRVALTQWACNPVAYPPTPSDRDIDVSFIGQAHGNRPRTIARLRDAGIDVATWGGGWPAGRIDQQDMLEVFTASRINLNLANASVPGGRVKRVLHRLGLGQDLPEQVKGRNFEIPACRGFQLTSAAERLEEHFVPGEEIVIFSDEDELPELIERWLSDEEGRRRLAEAGHRRTLAEHTYERRFRTIFDQLELWR